MPIIDIDLIAVTYDGCGAGPPSQTVGRPDDSTTVHGSLETTVRYCGGQSLSRLVTGHPLTTGQLSLASTERKAHTQRNGGINVASIVAFCSVRRLRRLRLLRLLRTFLASPASDEWRAKTTQGPCVACVALDGNWALVWSV